MKHRILGTAGHIDHGKTTLVRALTGIDTDRLAEEKARGITIDLGFAELAGGDVHLGVVDVPGHEGFIRNMVAGATGMDVVLLVVAADEGVMPQTREHLAILSQLRVDRLVVAITKSDLVEPEWIELVVDEVSELVAEGRFGEVPILAVSAETGEGVDALRDRLLDLAGRTRDLRADDVVVLPIDRAFTVKGTGTVVTGTLISGIVHAGDRIRLLPDGLEGRVRGVQSHGADVESAGAGARVALALTGDRIDLENVERGQLLVTEPGWGPTAMATVRVSVLEGTGWRIEQGQRVRVHHGTAEVMARCVLLDGAEAIEPGANGWVQLRLERPIGARCGDHVVLRSYSPVTTIGGGRIAESHPPKRGSLAAAAGERLARLLDSERPDARVRAVLEGAGESGVPVSDLPVLAACTPAEATRAIEALMADGAARTRGGRAVDGEAVGRVAHRVMREIDRVHRDEAYLAVVGREVVRSVAGVDTAGGLVDAVVERLIEEGEIEEAGGGLRRPGFRPSLDAVQQALRDEIVERLVEGGLAPPLLDEFEDRMRTNPAFSPILRTLEAEGEIVRIHDGFAADAGAVARGVAAVREQLGGRDDLGPGDFREALPVTRKHLMPLLEWMDREGITERIGDVRAIRR